ncbi:MAG: GFA family protein [Arenicellales bacterium]
MQGRCLCGGVRYEVRCRPDALYYCHCSQCRRASGSSFATNVAVPRRDLAFIEGEHLIKPYASAPGKHRNFCSNCGSPLYSEYLEEPDIVYLRAGTLDDTGELRACAHIWVSSKASWYDILDDLPRHAGDTDVAGFP